MKGTEVPQYDKNNLTNMQQRFKLQKFWNLASQNILIHTYDTVVLSFHFYLQEDTEIIKGQLAVKVRRSKTENKEITKKMRKNTVEETLN